MRWESLNIFKSRDQNKGLFWLCFNQNTLISLKFNLNFLKIIFPPSLWDIAVYHAMLVNFPQGL